MASHKPIQATLAFIFNKDLTKVLLITKQKPVQHKGMVNGLGGKLELNESHLDCVVREIEEESGLKTTPQAWTRMGNITMPEWQMSVLTTITKHENLPLPDETVKLYPINALPRNVITNLRWLIPLAIDINQKVMNDEKSCPTFEITYN